MSSITPSIIYGKYVLDAMYMVLEPPHRIRLLSSIQPHYISISSDYSQKYVFISTPTTINFYTSTIAIELISQYILTDEQTKEFGFIVDVKSSQALPLLSVITDNDYLLILTYEKELESFERLNSDGSISTPRNSSSFIVSGELHLLMAFSLSEFCSTLSVPSKANSASLSTLDCTSGTMPFASPLARMDTLWDKNLLMIKTDTHLLALDFDKIAASKIKVVSSDRSTDKLTLTLNSRQVNVGDDQVGLVFLTTNEQNNNNTQYNNNNIIGSYDNHIFYRDLYGRLVSIGQLGSIVIADNIGPFAISSIIAYSTPSSGILKLLNKSKSGTYELLSELNLKGDIKLLNWCPNGHILAIIHKKSNDSKNSDYRLSLFNLSHLTTTKIQFSEPFNLAWSSFGLRLFLTTMDSVFLFDIFRPSGWYSGPISNNSILIGPSGILTLQSSTSFSSTSFSCNKTTSTLKPNKYNEDIEGQYIQYDYPLSASPYWPFIFAFSNPSDNLFLIRSHNGALLLCSKEPKPLNVTNHFMRSKSGNNLLRKNSSIDNLSIVYLNRHWRLIEFQLEIDNSLEYDTLPCCWINDNVFLTVGISQINILNNVMKLCRLSNETVTILATHKIRRSPIMAKRVDSINFTSNDIKNGYFFYLLTRFDKVEVYNWPIGTDIIQIVLQIDLAFPTSLFNSNNSTSSQVNGANIEENSPIHTYSPSKLSNRDSPLRQSPRNRLIDYFHVKSIHIQSINMIMDDEETFKLTLETSNEIINIIISNGCVISGILDNNILVKYNINDNGVKHYNKLSNIIGIANANISLESIKNLFDTSKRHFEKNGKLADLKLITYKDQVPNGMLMRISRMSLEYGTLDKSISEVFDLFISSKDYLNASLILICIQEIFGVNDMIEKYAKPLLIDAIKALGHQPSLIQLIQQLIRIVETVKGSIEANILESVNNEIIKAASCYVLHDFLGLLRVVLLLKLPLVNVISSTKLDWRLSDCETHFGNCGITLYEMLSSVRQQFFTDFQQDYNDRSHTHGDGWSISSVIDLLLPIYHVCLEAGANAIAFAIALAIGDKSLAQLSVNGHIAGEIDRLDPDCSKCNQAKQLIALII